MVYFIPERNTDIANIYVYTDVETKEYIEGLGTYLYPTESAKIAVLMYKYPKYRRAYVIGIPSLHGSKLNLPYIEGSYDILYSAFGRRVDLLKYALYNLRRLYGDTVFTYSEGYWMRLCSLLNHFTGTKSGCTKYAMVKLYHRLKTEGFYL